MRWSVGGFQRMARYLTHEWLHGPETGGCEVGFGTWSMRKSGGGGVKNVLMIRMIFGHCSNIAYICLASTSIMSLSTHFTYIPSRSAFVSSRLKCIMSPILRTLITLAIRILLGHFLLREMSLAIRDNVPHMIHVVLVIRLCIFLWVLIQNVDDCATAVLADCFAAAVVFGPEGIRLVREVRGGRRWGKTRGRYHPDPVDSSLLSHFELRGAHVEISFSQRWAASWRRGRRTVEELGGGASACVSVPRRRHTSRAPSSTPAIHYLDLCIAFQSISYATSQAHPHRVRSRLLCTFSVPEDAGRDAHHRSDDGPNATAVTPPQNPGGYILSWPPRDDH